MIYNFFHRGCPDGTASGYAMWKRFGVTANYKGILHDEPIPVIFPSQYDCIYFGDICPRWEYLLDIADCSVTIMDHHGGMEDVMKRATDELGFTTIFDNNHSGAVITWETLLPNKPVPQLLLHVEDRDLWRFKLPYTLEIMEALWSYPREFELWDKWAYDVTPLIEEGKILVRAKQQAIKGLINHVRIIEIDGYKVPAINTPMHQSDTLHYILGMEEYKQYPFGAYYYDTEGKRKWGLRSREQGPDVSKIAARFGGNGHSRAAGMVTPI